MSALSDKILSYSPEQYIRFNTAYSTSPTNLGNGGQDTWTLSGEAPTLNASGGPDGEGHWEFNPGGNNDTTPTRFQISTTAARVALDNELTDADFSAGVWFKFNTISPTTTSMANGMRMFELLTKGFLAPKLEMTYANGANQGKLSYTNTTGSVFYTNSRYDDNAWHYAATRVVSSTSGTIDSVSYYIDGQLLATFGSVAWGASTTRTIRIGDNSQTATPDIIPRYALSNFYIATSSAINATAISEIWTAGQPGGTNITITETPATATALMVDPTVSVNSNAVLSETPATATALINHPTIVVTQQGDHTEITTSFIGSAEFLPNFAVFASVNKNIVITETLNASVELINNVLVATGNSVDISANEFIASATFVKPFVAEQPMTASATMPGGTAVLEENYFRLVKTLNPYLYIFDGKGSPFDQTVSSGYQSGTFTKDLDVQYLQNLGNPLNLVGEGKSWLGPNGASDGKFQFTTPTSAESFSELVSTGNFAWEAWIKPSFLPYYLSDPTFFYVRGPVRFALVPQVQNAFPQPNTVPKVRVQIQNSATGSAFHTFEINRTSTPFSANNWAHVVVQSYNDGTAGKRRAELWINGSRYITEQYNYTDWTSTVTTDVVFGSDRITQFGTTTASFSNQGIDEVAIYSQALTNSQIINHYNFISTLSPNVEYNADFMDADVDSGDHAVLAIDNVTIAETPATSNAVFVNPAILAVKNLSTFATPLTASATNTDVTIYYGWTIYADFAIAAAESKEGFALNTTYYDYVIANINPYRYVSFDTSTPLADYGIDNDYSVVPTAIGGTIVNPDLGINGKSVKTAGTSYITDGVILKESEYNDDWGTTANTYHSAFWFQKAVDDNSTTGLRVLWNLNGHYDNQHIILYQYQNKLTLSFSDGTVNFINQSTLNNINLFDGLRHFIVIYVDHQGVNDKAYLYVDAVLQMTVDLGTYRVEPINGITIVGPNDEANNYPRLSVGCLITPFAATALPVVPANTKLIIDEVYWDKNAINQTMVTNLYNVMPDKTNVDFISEALLASATTVMPAISTTVNFVADSATASGELVDPSLFVVKLLNIAADSMNVSAFMAEATGFVPINVLADVFVVTAIFNDAGLTFTIPAPTMFASVELVNRPNPFVLPTDDYGISVSTNGIRYELREFSPYVRYLRIVARNQKMYKDMEIL